MFARRIALVLAALTVAGVTAMVGRTWLQAERATLTTQTIVSERPVAQVLVAKGELSAGQFARPENLRWQAWPADGIATAYVTPEKHKMEDFVGAVVRSGIGDGEPVTEGRLVRPGDRGFLAAVLTPGMRAVTVAVTPSSGLAGFVFPGDRVDLILTLQVAREEKTAFQHHASETVLTGVRVLATDQRVDDQKKEVVVAKTATLEVSAKQAEIIAVVSEIGKLSLSLRSLAQDGVPEDPPFSHTWDTEATRLLPPPPTPAAIPLKVSVVRGADAKDVEFARGNR